MKSTYDMTTGAISPLILKFFFPTLLGNVFQQLYNMVDSAIVGRFVGPDALGSVGSVGSIMFLVLGTASGMASGFCIRIGHEFGVGDIKSVKKSMASGIILSFLSAVSITAVSAMLIKSILRLMQTPAELFDNAYDYIIIIILGIIITIYFNYFSMALRTVGNSKTPLVALIISSLINIILDLVLIINFNMGVKGAALATVISQGISAVYCWIYIMRRVPELYPDKDMYVLTKRISGSQLRVAFPMALQFGVTASSTAVVQAGFNTFGAVAVSGCVSATRIFGLFNQAFFSMGQTVTAFVGQNYGTKDIDRIKKGVKYSVVFIGVLSIVLGVVINIIIPYTTPLFFPKDTDMAPLMPWAKTYVLVASFFMMPLSWIFIYRSAINAIGKSMLASVVGFAELFSRLAVFALTLYTHEFIVACLMDGASWLMGGITGLFLFYKLRLTKT